MAEDRSRKFAILAIAGSVVAIVSALIIVPFLTTSAQQPEGEQRRIIALESRHDFRSGQSVTQADYVKLPDMEPNSARWFLDPFGKTMEGKSTAGFVPKAGMTINGSEWSLQDDFEAFEIYTIIRLPAFFGGSEASVSSYRAYNTISISVHCVSKYWNQEGRWHIADPCSGDLYRPWDGVAVAGPAAVGISGGGIVSTGQFGALASLDLSVDSEGYITATRPSRGSDANGMPGEGRQLSFEDVRSSNGKMLAAAGTYTGYDLPFPSAISGNYYLSELRLSSGTWWQGDWNDKMPGAIEAAYSHHPLSSGNGFEQILMTTYPLQKFPDMALNSPIMVNGSINLMATDLKGELEKLDVASVSSLISIEGPFPNEYEIEAAKDVGIFSVTIAPSQVEPADQRVSGALIWATSPDDRAEQLITIRTWPALDLSELKEILRSLQVE